MATTKLSLLDEIADFLASNPSREELIGYRPPEQTQERAQELLEKQGEGTITYLEQRELDQFEAIERLLRLIKAKLQTKKAQKK